MSQVVASSAPPLPQGIERAQAPGPDAPLLRALYARNHFLSLHRALGPLWHRRELVPGLGTEELIFAGRIAGRLGSEKLRRALFRLAATREPANPYVRYYNRTVARRRETLYAYFRDFERAPELETDDVDLASSWWAEHAIRRAVVRDFEEAERSLARACSFGQPSAWIDACRASVLLAQDRFEEAHATAERAWARSPGMPFAASMLAATLGALGRTSEAADRLLAFTAETPESYETLTIAIQCAFFVAERCAAEEQRRWGATLMARAERLGELAPLADRTVSRRIDALRLHAAQLAGDRSAVKRLAVMIGSPFYREAARNLERRPDGARILLQHRFSRQRHNTCLPASLAACLGAFGIDLDHDAVAKELTFEGTSWWRVADWARERGYAAIGFIADAASATRLLELGLPFIIGHESLSRAHACAVIGVDRAMGTLLYHDPESDHLGEVLIEKLGRFEAPFGPRALLVAPADRIPPDLELNGVREEQARVELERTLERGATAEASAELFERLEREAPDGEVTALLRARVASVGGQPARALQLYRELYARHPEVIAIQRAVLESVAALGDTAALRETLRSILDRVPVPGIAERYDWVHADPHLSARYADLLRQSAQHHAEAERHLERALHGAPTSGEVYHILGDLLWQRGEHAAALLPFRLGSTLDLANEHYAVAYALALRRVGREDDAIVWLKRRVAHFQGNVGGERPWMTLIQTEESFGFPESALSDLSAARASWPKSGAVASFAAEVFARHGRAREAAAALEDARVYGSEGQYRSAAIPLARLSGGGKEAHAHALAWVEAVPTSAVARSVLLELTEERDGVEAALELAERWAREFEKDESFEELLLEVLTVNGLSRGDRDDQRLALLRARVERNPLDAWAWRELASTLLAGAVSASEAQQGELLPELRGVIDRCVAAGPDHPGTVALCGELEALQGDLAAAKRCLRRALELDPGMEAVMVRLVRLASRADEEEKREVAELVGRALARAEGSFRPLRVVLPELASLLGAREAEALATRWVDTNPDDPVLTEAWADLLLYHGQGRAAAEVVLPRLERAIGRYPIHPGLRHSLAVAYRVLGREDDAVRQLREVFKLAPHQTGARLELAGLLEKRGRVDEAEQVLSKAVELSPRMAGHWLALAGLYARSGRLDQALGLLDEASAKLPSTLAIWQLEVELQLQGGRPEAALATARSLVERSPRWAAAVLLLARVEQRAHPRADRASVQALYERALELDVLLFEALDELVELLCRDASFDEAEGALLSRLPRYQDPLPIRRKLAEVARQRGDADEALALVAALVREHPRDVRSWQLAIDWLAEDHADALARELLPRMEIALEHPSLHCDRLVMLERLGWPREQLDREWSALIRNFPSSMEVNLRRADGLFGDGRFEESFACLESYRAQDPGSPQVVARLARALAKRGDAEQALACAERVWTSGEELSPLTVELLIAALDAGGLLERSIQRALELVAARVRVPSACLVKLAVHAGEKGHRGLLERMVEVYERSDLGFDAGTPLAYALDLLSARLGAPEVAIAFARRNPARVSGDVQLWEVVGAAHLRAGDLEGARAWLGEWQAHPGVGMWAVTNYTAACMEAGDLDACARAAAEALERLPHDGTAPNLVERLLLVHLSRGELGRFEEVHARHGVVLEQAASDRPARRWVELFAGLGGATGAAELRALAREAEVVSKQDPALAAELAPRFRARLREKLPLLSRWLHAIFG